MSVDYKTDIQSENKYRNDIEMYVDRMDRNGVDYKTQLIDAFDTISAMELETNKLKQRIKLADMKYQELNEKYVKVLSDLWNSK
jgi:hypothetical protein